MILTVNNRRFRDREVLFSTWCNQKNEALRMMMGMEFRIKHYRYCMASQDHVDHDGII